MKSWAWIVACMVAVMVFQPGAALADEAKGLLDGMTFFGQVCAKGKAEGDLDVFTFKDGRFYSLACDKDGFGDAAYTATNEGGFIVFKAEMHSSSGTITWQGRATKNSVDGSMVFRRKTTWYNFVLPSAEEKIFTAKSK
ncbi:MAG: hypothetical protein V1929_11690 [bacterium]